jgi:hypothetical protein
MKHKYLAEKATSQVYWLQKERMMFVHFAPNTRQGREYDNHSYPIEKMHLKPFYGCMSDGNGLNRLEKL